MLNGIDVSNLQGSAFDWAPYRGRIQFAGIKVSEGTGFADPDAARNMAQAKADGIVRMAYHFLRPAQHGGQQADYFLHLARLAGLGPGDLVMVDVEVADNLSAAQVSGCAADFAARVHAAVGAWPVAYTMQSFAEGGYCASLGMCPSFIANPSHVQLPSPIGPWHLVSFEQTGQRGVDTDVFYGDLAELAKLAILHPAPKPRITQEQAKAAIAGIEEDLANLTARTALLAAYAAQG